MISEIEAEAECKATEVLRQFFSEHELETVEELAETMEVIAFRTYQQVEGENEYTVLYLIPKKIYQILNLQGISGILGATYAIFECGEVQYAVYSDAMVPIAQNLTRIGKIRAFL